MVSLSQKCWVVINLQDIWGLQFFLEKNSFKFSKYVYIKLCIVLFKFSKSISCLPLLNPLHISNSMRSPFFIVSFARISSFLGFCKTIIIFSWSFNVYTFFHKKYNTAFYLFLKIIFIFLTERERAQVGGVQREKQAPSEQGVWCGA